jgi:trans-2,3-dihydro-3-hydroxyanthranilate isomerase
LLTEFNLSEITFPDSISREDAKYHNRIFIVGAELPFAGHPTLGTCFALLHRGLQSEKPEIIQVSGSGETRLSYAKIPSSPFQPARIGMRATTRHCLTQLQLFEENLKPAFGFSKLDSVKLTGISSCGLSWPFVQLQSVEDVKAVQIDARALSSWVRSLRGSLGDGPESENEINAVAVFAIDHSKSEHNKTSIFARILCVDAETMVIVEDPATGSAGLALGPLLYKEKLLTQSLEYVILQGTEVKMPSQLFGRVELDDKGEAVAVHLSGDVVKVGSGEIVCPP